MKLSGLKFDGFLGVPGFSISGGVNQKRTGLLSLDDVGELNK